MLEGCFGRNAASHLDARLAMQLVNEAALCVNRLRKKDSLCHQGFSLVNGMNILAADHICPNNFDFGRIFLLNR